jgi:hypothetical protein
MPRHIQHRPATRAPHGSPQFTVYIGGWATENQKAWLMKHGASSKLRELIDAAMLAEATKKARTKHLPRIVAVPAKQIEVAAYVRAHEATMRAFNRAAGR